MTHANSKRSPTNIARWLSPVFSHFAFPWQFFGPLTDSFRHFFESYQKVISQWSLAFSTPYYNLKSRSSNMQTFWTEISVFFTHDELSFFPSETNRSVFLHAKEHGLPAWLSPCFPRVPALDLLLTFRSAFCSDQSSGL